MEEGRNTADFALEFAAGYSHLEVKRERQRMLDGQTAHYDAASDTDDDATEADFKVFLS
jgi:hypothetical protein